MKNQDYNDIFVIIQQQDNIVANVSYELIGKAQELAVDLNCCVAAIVPGHNVDEICENLAGYGVDKIIAIDDPVLEKYMTEPYTHVITEVVNTYKPEIVLFGATAIGRDLAPRVCARVNTGLTADCTALEIDPETKDLLMTRPAFGGNIMATILCSNHRPQMATVRPGVMQKPEPDENKSCSVEKFTVTGLASRVNVEIIDIVKKVGRKIDIQNANTLISGGRGMGDPQNFKMLEDLADILGGEVASSRSAVDMGWVEKDRQVGQTGKTVRPNLYIACGISGAVQHIVGMEESEVIVAINTDPSAPIFEVADYGIVGDALKIIPLLIQEIKKL